MGKGQCEATIEVSAADTVYCVRTSGHAGPHSAADSCRDDVREAKRRGARWTRRPERPR